MESRYGDDNTLRAEREDLKSLLMKVKEESEKVGLKWHLVSSFMANRWGNKRNSERLYILGAPKSLQTVTATMILKCLLLGRKPMTNPESILNSRDITLLTKVCLVKAMVFPVWMWALDHKESWAPKNWWFWTGVGEYSWESLGLPGDQTSQS